MSRCLFKAALVLGAAALLANSARADHYQWFGPYDSQGQANAVGQAELDNNGGGHYASDFQSEDPTGGGQGAGYYVLVYYPDAPAPVTPPDPGGLLGVPFPGDPGPADPGMGEPGADNPDPADPGRDDPGPDDDGGMGS